MTWINTGMVDPSLVVTRLSLPIPVLTGLDAEQKVCRTNNFVDGWKSYRQLRKLVR